MTASEPGRRRRALVTGGAVRVGRAIALGLGRAGYDVAVHYNDSAEAAEGAVEAVRSEGSAAHGLRADLSDAAAIPRLVGRAAELLGGLDLLVNSAAIFPRARPAEVSLEAWDRVFALNARAPFLCAREAAARMEEGGSIVNIADVAAFEGWPSFAPYAATQAALVSLTRSLALAWAPRIRVNAVAPGPVLLPEGSAEEEHRRAAASTALGRVGTPEDVAGAVLYLDGAGFVTGEVLRVDGGAHLARSTEG
jgi:pteridine reductase